MFRAAKITLRIGFTARHFDQFRDCSTGRTFHTPAAFSRARRARYITKRSFSETAKSNRSRAEAPNSHRGGAHHAFSLYIFFPLIADLGSREISYSAANSRGAVRDVIRVLFPSTHAPHRPPVRRTRASELARVYQIRNDFDCCGESGKLISISRDSRPSFVSVRVSITRRCVFVK